VRVFTNRKYPNNLQGVPLAFDILENMVSTYGTTHQFWNDSVSLRDDGLFQVARIMGHKQITDVYLLGLCQQQNGTLVTLDDKMTTDALVAPHPDLLLKL